MSAQSVNIMMGCEGCTFANAYGQGCKHGLLFPVMALMAGYERCPNYKPKTREQVEEQIRTLSK